MKIVEFEDGNFAIRQLTLYGYRFLSLVEDYWWSEPYAQYYCYGSLVQICKRLEELPSRCKVKKVYSLGICNHCDTRKSP